MTIPVIVLGGANDVLVQNYSPEIVHNIYIFIHHELLSSKES